MVQAGFGYPRAGALTPSSTGSAGWEPSSDTGRGKLLGLFQAGTTRANWTSFAHRFLRNLCRDIVSMLKG